MGSASRWSSTPKGSSGSQSKGSNLRLVVKLQDCGVSSFSTVAVVELELVMLILTEEQD